MIAKIMTAKKLYIPPTAKIYLLAIRNPSKTEGIEKKTKHTQKTSNKTKHVEGKFLGTGGNWENY